MPLYWLESVLYLFSKVKSILETEAECFIEEVWMVVARMFIRDIRDMSGTLPESCVSGPNRKPGH